MFQPTEITDTVDWEKKRASVSFVHKGKKYYFELKFNDDWVDINVAASP